MVVALTVTPAMSLILLPRTRLERGDAPVVRWLKRAYGGLLARVIRRPWPVFGAVAVVAVAGIAVTPLLGSSLLPNFKERDFLMHWLTKPGTSLPEETRISLAACRELRTIPAVRNCGSHIGQADFSDEVVNVDFGENWVSVDPEADYEEALASIHGVVDGYPGLFRDVLTYLRERVREVLTGSEPRDRRPDLRARPGRAQAGGGRGAGGAGRDRRARRSARRAAGGRAAHRGRNKARCGASPRPQARRHPTRGGDADAGNRGQRHLAAGPCLRRQRVEHAADAEESLEHPGASDRHLSVAVELGEVADIRVAPTPNTIERENISRRIDVTADYRARTSARSRGRSRMRSHESTFRAGTTRSCSASRPSGGCPEAPSLAGPRRRRCGSPAPPGRLRQLAPGCALLCDPPDGARRRRPGRVRHRRDDFTRPSSASSPCSGSPPATASS